MVFSSIVFLFFFLPITLAVYFCTPHRARNVVLLVASLVFYTWGGGAFVLILLASIVVNWLIGLRIGRAVETGTTRRRNGWIAVSVAANLAVLGYFKYANFFVDQVNDVADQLGIGPAAWTNVALPIGVSFYTFQSLSYTMDVARGRNRSLRNPLDYALFVMSFPHLVAGPLIRYHTIADELRDRHRVTRFEDFAEGSMRFVYGLGKKVIIADSLAPVADAAFNAPAGQLSAVGAWIGLLAYTFQIYFDFSGYSDMAIGLARMFGFHFPENFRRPYSALSITDFWRRWHMTLSDWFRDYLYTPLGGNRGTGRRTAVNLLIVFAATGLWHGAAWTFLAWGMLHGSVMLWERMRGTRYVDSAPHEAWARARTFLIVMVAWILFRASSIGNAARYAGALVGQGSGVLSADVVLRTIDVRELAVLVIALATLLLPGTFVGGRAIIDRTGRRAGAARFAVMVAAFPVSLLLVVSGTFSPFLYFNF